MELWLVRHGTTTANLEGRVQGTLDYPLSEIGKKESYLLAQRLKKQTFSLFFSSSLLRARQTSAIISSAGNKASVLYSPILREYDFGIIQGFTKKEIQRQYPRLFNMLQQDFHHTAIPKAEGLKRLLARVKAFYRFLLLLEQKGSFSKPVLIVGHGRFLQAFVLYYLKYDFRESWPFSLDPASLSILDGDFGKQRRLRLFNDTCHLK
ncbi:MAG: histidine phosphatase family protein [Firmicutes bacterium]|nr:histidine phosphatase family protein [Bacillota bacterium]